MFPERSRREQYKGEEVRLREPQEILEIIGGILVSTSLNHRNQYRLHIDFTLATTGFGLWNHVAEKFIKINTTDC